MNQELNQNLIIDYPDGSQAVLSESLIAQQGLTPDRIELLKEYHVRKFNVIAKMEGTDDSGELKVLAEKVKEIEFELQRLWGFDKDETYHYWYEVPKCQCPKIDNAERRGTNYQIVNMDCPVHGGEVQEQSDGWFKKMFGMFKND